MVSDVSSAMDRPAVCSMPWSCCSPWDMRKACAGSTHHYSMCSSAVSCDSSKCVPKTHLGPSQSSSLFTPGILALGEIKPPSHTSGSSQRSWEIRAEGCWLLLAVNLGGFRGEASLGSHLCYHFDRCQLRFEQPVADRD